MKNYNESKLDSDILTTYLKEINKIPLLSRQEEDFYARKAKNGNLESRQVLIKANLRFVVNVAKKYQNQGLHISDLISEGNVGLLHAIDKFDIDKGYHFISYAVWWIRQSILKAICEKSRMIRLPLNRANELVQIEKAKKQLNGELTEENEFKKISQDLNMDEKHIKELLNITKEHISLEATIKEDKNSSTRGDFIEDKCNNSRPEDISINKSLKENVELVLTTLDKKEADIIRYRFGLSGKKSLPLKEIGKKYNLTKERIRQIEKKAIKKLQSVKRKKYLEEYVNYYN